MGSFFVALIGLLCLAGGKAVDSAIIKGQKRNRAERDKVCSTTYKDLRIDYSVSDDAVRIEFKKLSVQEITRLLAEDVFYVTGERKNEEYFRKALECKDPGVEKGLILLWLSKNGVIPSGFADDSSNVFQRGISERFNRIGSFYMFFEMPEQPIPTSIFEKVVDNKPEADSIKKAYGLRILKRVEYNIRKKYPEFRFVFSSDPRNPKEKYGDIFKTNFHVLHEVINKESYFRGWEDNETTQYAKDEGDESDGWNSMTFGEKSFYFVKALLFCCCISSLLTACIMNN